MFVFMDNDLTVLSMLNDSHFHWKKAFPLYGRNHDSVMEATEKMEKNLPGFFYAGNKLSDVLTCDG